MPLYFIYQKLLRIKVYIAEIGILDLLCSCNLDLDPMTFIYELDPYLQEIYGMCENERQGFPKLSYYSSLMHAN